MFNWGIGIGEGVVCITWSPGVCSPREGVGRVLGLGGCGGGGLEGSKNHLPSELKTSNKSLLRVINPLIAESDSN